MVNCLLLGGVLLALGGDQSIAPTEDDRRVYEAASAKAGRDADAHVKLALWCEEHGLAAERLKHLALAVVIQPKQAAARGLLGLVAYRGQWQRPELVGEKVRADTALAATLAEYNAKREAMPNTSDAHWQLALWCEDHGLAPEATAHLTAVTRLDPGRDAAWKRLGCKKHEGRWLTPEQIATLKSEQQQQRQADRRWRPLLEKWRDHLSDRTRHDAAELKLSEVTDPRAVPMIWAVFGTGDAGRQLVAVRVLGQIDAGTASRALAGFAVFGKSAEVRRIATETLKRRDPRDFVNLLIGLIRDPIRYEVRPVDGPGSAGVLFVEGKRFNVQRIYRTQAIPAAAFLPRLFSNLPYNPYGSQNLWQAGGSPGATVGNFSKANIQGIAANPQAASAILGIHPSVISGGPAINAAAVAARQDIQIASNVNRFVQAASNVQAKLAQDVNELEMANASIHETNQSTLPVLNAVTGQEMGEDQTAWRSWWSDQQGYKYDASVPTVKPTYTQFVESPGGQVHHACFAAGTLVRTLEGPRPIETIKVGDQVLSQDVRTGSLGFEPVLTVYHNRPASTLRIALEKETIVATGIHRFWKAGHGWIMARDLKPGDPIRTIDGPARVRSVEDDSVQPVFNLEVAQYGSYFVGQAGTLVHDNSLVEPVAVPFDAAPALAASAGPGR